MRGDLSVGGGEDGFLGWVEGAGGWWVVVGVVCSEEEWCGKGSSSLGGDWAVLLLGLGLGLGERGEVTGCAGGLDGGC